MGREADQTIKGFLYQFIKTLNEILKSDINDEIQVEGIIEDIDIVKSHTINAIQCKYHESNDKFSLSHIYKPVLQMLCNFSEKDTSKIKYILYAHFPNENVGIKKITKEQIKEILSTNNLDYISKYVSKVKPPKDPKIKELIKKARKTSDEKSQIKQYYDINKHKLDVLIDIDSFLQNHFTFQIGPSYEDLSNETKKLMENEGFSKEDVNDIFYPNAIQFIAELSILPEAEKRITSKKQLLSFIKENKKTAISRWTRELLTHKELLKIRRRQLLSGLNVNTRSRYFIIDPNSLENFDDEFILFVKNYLEKYNSKIKLHTETPCFFIKTDINRLSEYHKRFVMRDISIITGFIGDTFYFKEFSREPKRIIKDNWVEFKAKISCFTGEVTSYINTNKCDDLFIIGDVDISSIDTSDVNVERLNVNNFKELGYLLSIIKEL
jgi:hypothetical protein